MLSWFHRGIDLRSVQVIFSRFNCDAECIAVALAGVTWGPAMSDWNLVILSEWLWTHTPGYTRPVHSCHVRLPAFTSTGDNPQPYRGEERSNSKARKVSSFSIWHFSDILGTTSVLSGWLPFPRAEVPKLSTHIALGFFHCSIARMTHEHTHTPYTHSHTMHM